MLGSKSVKTKRLLHQAFQKMAFMLVGMMFLAGNPALAQEPTKSMLQRQGTNSTLPGAADTRAPKSITVPLQHISGQQLEETLLRMMGNRFTAVAPAELGAKSYHLILPGGAIVRLDILPQLDRASVYGAQAAAESFARLLHALDAPARAADESTRLVSLNQTSLPAARRAVEAIQSAGTEVATRDPSDTTLFQSPKEAPTLLAQADNDSQAPASPQRNQQAGESQQGRTADSGQLGPVQVEVLEGLDVLIIRGHGRDVEQVMSIIQQIEQFSALTEPAIE